MRFRQNESEAATRGSFLSALAVGIPVSTLTIVGGACLLRDLLAQRDRGELTRGATTLADFKEEWLRACRLRNCRPRTLDTYREKLETHVIPTLGKERLDRLTATDVEKLYHHKLDAGLSPGRITASSSATRSAARCARGMLTKSGTRSSPTSAWKRRGSPRSGCTTSGTARAP